MKSIDVSKYDKKIKNKLIKDVKKGNLDAVLADVAALSEIYYEWNQFYTSVTLEDICLKIGEKLISTDELIKMNNTNTVLYYDAFGHDTRGLSLMYLKALSELGFNLVYITRLDKKGLQPVLSKTLKKYHVQVEYMDFTSSYGNQIHVLDSLIKKYNPSKTFIYTLPYDVTAAVVFSRYKGIVQRYKINLTDHAYWLGTNTFDNCIEFRNYGASISVNKRNIDASKLVCLPYYPYIDKNVSFQGLPFDERQRFVFSGGSLYKTIGEENKYYKVVEHILSQDKNIVFLYAGSGDDTMLKKTMEKYPGRIVHISERKDFFELIKRSEFYLNTYPTVGGMMMQYSALAGKLPVTLRHNVASSGLLINQERLDIEFDTLEDIFNEIDKLLGNNEYLINKESLLEGSVISEDDFKKALLEIIQNKDNGYSLRITDVDTKEIAKEYQFRMNINCIMNAVAKKRHVSLARIYPLFFVKRYMKIGMRKGK